MPNLSQLSKRRQYRFLSQLVEYLETYSKRVREFFRFSFNAPTQVDGPRLYILGEMLLWEFSYQQLSRWKLMPPGRHYRCVV